MPVNYPEFFREVTGKEILPYQERYGADPFSPVLLIIPTGLGKTDAVLTPWLYTLARGGHSAPRRLIFVLPRQNLTAQVAQIARERVNKAGLSIRVLELMAGSDDNDQGLRPDEPAIIIATQDLYFSRALNRGYARRPPRWPIDFALYNQDCLIVLDEIQLMDDALATSTQLAAFRERFGTYAQAPSVWMSATVNPAWLRTVDFRGSVREIRLDDADRQALIVKQRIRAPKSLARAPESCNAPAGCAEFALSKHEKGTRTLVIVNTVARAREIFTAIKPQFPEAVLLHSRFRPGDRRIAAEKLKEIPDQGQIIVATQVLEAGVDISAKRLITDVAPWAGLVQRFGRVNRYGELARAEIWWVDAPAAKKQKDPAVPYSKDEVEIARQRLARITSASPEVLETIPEEGPAPWKHVLRRADLMDLFDTTPDVSGNHIDVSRFIRATEDRDVYLAWRTWDRDTGPPRDLEDIADDELCPVPIGEFREFAQKHPVYAWNFATEEWEYVDRDRALYPGMLTITQPESGGYTAEQGWFPESNDPVREIPLVDGTSVEGDTDDKPSFQRYQQTLCGHTIRIMEEMEQLLANISMNTTEADALRIATLKHDWGKAHEVFQETMHRGNEGTQLLAKRVGWQRHKRRHFRHELASALAMLAIGDSDLAAYLAAAHHGRVRLGIRSMPGEAEDEMDQRTARGIRDGDVLPACELAPGVIVPETTVSLSVMEFGTDEGSWTERMLRLRDEYGPFRLAYLEMLLRAADAKASDEPRLEAACNA